MPPTAQKPNSRGVRRPLPPRAASSLWYGLALLLVLGLVQMYYMTPGGRSVPYSEFKTMVQNGQVAEVLIGDQTIHGTLKPGAGAAGDEKSRQFTTTRVEDPKLAEELQAKGVKNIDVGCMQVNLMHHGVAFRDLEEAFDPIHNALYAAAFLKELRMERRSWSGAVATYHSSDPARGNAYSDKVFALWQNENQREFKAALAARQALYDSRRAQLASR